MKNKSKATGWFEEEFITASAHFFDEGKLQFHDNEPLYGDYTGRFRFIFTDRLGNKLKTTNWYTKRTSPKWLLGLYEAATNPK